MSEEIEIVEDKKVFELRYGRVWPTCPYIKAAMRLIAILGEPAKEIAHLMAKTVDYYTASPKEEAERAFGVECAWWGCIYRYEIIDFGKKLF